MPSFAIKSRTHPRRDGGASGNARAPTFAAARPAAAPPFKLHLAPTGASVSRPFTRSCTALRRQPPCERSAFKNFAHLPSGKFTAAAAYCDKPQANVRCITPQRRTRRAGCGNDHPVGARPTVRATMSSTTTSPLSLLLEPLTTTSSNLGQGRP